MRYPVTPEGRYFVVSGRLWRCSNPSLMAEVRPSLTRDLDTSQGGRTARAASR